MDPMAVRLRELLVASDWYRRAMATVIGVGPTEAAALGETLHAGPLPPSLLVKRLGIASASVTALLDRLETAGLVERQPNPADRRSVLVALTPRGRSVVEAQFALFTADVAAAIRAAEPENVDEFNEMLGRIIATLRSRAADPDALASALRRQVDSDAANEGGHR